MSVGQNRAGGLILLVFSCTYAFLSFDIAIPMQMNEQFNPRSMPQALAVIATVISLALLCSRSSAAITWVGWRWGLGAAFIALMSAYGLLIRPVGFLLSTTVFLTGGLYMLGERRHAIVASVSILVAVGFWLLMTQVLGVYLPAMPASFLTGGSHA